MHRKTNGKEKDFKRLGIVEEQARSIHSTIYDMRVDVLTLDLIPTLVEEIYELVYNKPYLREKIRELLPSMTITSDIKEKIKAAGIENNVFCIVSGSQRQAHWQEVVYYFRRSGDAVLSTIFYEELAKHLTSELHGFCIKYTPEPKRWYKDKPFSPCCFRLFTNEGNYEKTNKENIINYQLIYFSSLRPNKVNLYFYDDCASRISINPVDYYRDSTIHLIELIKGGEPKPIKSLEGSNRVSTDIIKHPEFPSQAYLDFGYRDGESHPDLQERRLEAMQVD